MERGQPITKGFGRLRQAVGIDERVEGQRQANVDLHSLRRWFISKARDALNAGAKGFTLYTVAETVGHAKGELGLSMTSRYAGRETMEAKAACVRAVRLQVEIYGHSYSQLGVTMALTKAEKKLTADAETIARMAQVDFWNVGTLAKDERKTHLQLAINNMVVGEVISRYTLFDDVLADLICRYYFPRKRKRYALWKTEKFRVFVKLFVEKDGNSARDTPSTKRGPFHDPKGERPEKCDGV
jgi:hypothetical protein